MMLIKKARGVWLVGMILCSFLTGVLPVCFGNEGVQDPGEAVVAPDVVQWEGTVSELPGGMKLGILVKFSPNEAGADGGWTATIDIPLQQVVGLALSDVVLTETELGFSIAQSAAVFHALIDAADGTKASGELSQAGMTFPLTMTKVAAGTESTVGVVNHPQTPKPPFDYVVREVSYVNALAEGVTLAGTLTMPNGEGPFAAVVMITGSGPQNRNEALLGHEPFAVIADYLTKRGIAVLRFDDRGVAESTGNFGTATSADFATDVQAGVTFLQGEPKIDKAHIGLMGHSEGGLIAPIVAAAMPHDVDFIVLLAGTGVSGRDILVRQVADISRANSAEAIDEVFIMKQSELQEALLDLVIADDDQEAIEEAFRTLSYHQLEALTDDTSAEVSEAIRAQVEAGLAGGLAQVQSPWFKYFLALDPAVALREVKCDVLAVNGSLDLQVAADQNLPTIVAALKAGGNEQVTTKEFAGMNHLFQSCETGSPSEYAEIEETISPMVLEFVGDWIGHTVGM